MSVVELHEGQAASLGGFVGSETSVPCLDGITRRYVDLDAAASTPALALVADAVEAFMPWYSSVHRGAGYKSQVATAAFEGARDAVAEFVCARAGDEVVFVRNSTEAINVAGALLPAGSRVLSSPVEHHSNMLPWRRHDVDLLPFTASPDELLEATAAALDSRRGATALLAVTGASNVTGEIWPIAALSRLAHQAGARILVDAAQLAPHRPIDMGELGVDLLVLSGHKLYAPYGAGVLVADRDVLAAAAPLLHGGGAVRFVTGGTVDWTAGPDRHEAGSPNVVGAVALGAACDALGTIGMDAVAAHERALAGRLWAGLSRFERLHELRAWAPGASDRVGLSTFTCDGVPARMLAAILSDEHAIGVRDGCFCAHPLMTQLLGVPPRHLARLRAEAAAGDLSRMPAAVRVSIGLHTRARDVDALLAALARVLGRDTPWSDSTADPLPLPSLPFRLAAVGHG